MHLYQISLSALTVATCSSLASVVMASPLQTSEVSTSSFKGTQVLPIVLESVLASDFEIEAVLDDSLVGEVVNQQQNPLVSNSRVFQGIESYDSTLSDRTNIQQLLDSNSHVEPQIIAQTGATSDAFVGDTFSEIDQLRQELLIDPLVAPITGARPSPASTFGTPTAYGASFRTFFIGGAFASAGDISEEDGSIGLGTGVGDPIETVGLEITYNIISLTDDFGDSGAVGFKLHKIFTQLDNLAVAVGWTNAIDYGDASDAEETVYGVLTKQFDLRPEASNRLPITFSLGVGTGDFRSLGAINSGDNPPNFFAGMGLRMIPQLSFVSSWTGNQLNMGVSTAPFRQVPFTLTVGAADVTSNRADGVRFSLSGGFGFRF